MKQEELIPSVCTYCTLYKDCQHPNIDPEGPLDAEVMIVGEAPGYQEDKLGRVFIGRSGDELNDGLEYAGLVREEILITNTCRCFPNGKPKPLQVRRCTEKYLFPLIDEVKPKIIVAVGAVPLKALTGLEGITKIQNVPIYSDRFECQILPLVHPAHFLRHGGHGRKEFREGLQMVKKLLNSSESYYDYGDYHTIQNTKQLSKVAAKIKAAGILCFDLEALGLDWSDTENNWVTAIGLATKPREVYLQPNPGPEEWEILRPVLEDPNVKKIGQNIKFDAHFLRGRYGIKIGNWYADTMLMHFLLDERRATHNLSDMVWEHIPQMAGYDSSIKMLGGAHKVPEGETLLTYCGGDVDCTFRLFEIFKAKLEDQGQWWFFQNIMMPAHEVLGDMEFHGVKFDKEYMEDLQTKLDIRLRKIDYKMRLDPGAIATSKQFDCEFKPRSYKQLQWFLFDYYGLPVLKKTKKDNPSTDASTIERYAKEFDNKYCRLLVEYRKMDKLKGTYLDGLLLNMTEDNIMYPQYHLEIAETGRTSSDKPNIQNIPHQKEFRNIVIARPGFTLLSVDFPQSEVRCAAMHSGDPGLIDVCNDPTKDFHTAMASKAFRIPYEEVTKEQRRDAKCITFGILYGMQSWTLAKDLGVSEEEAESIINDYFSGFTTLKKTIENTHKLIWSQGYVVSPFGRRRRIHKRNELDKFQRLAAERECYNFIVQSMSSDFLLIVLRRVWNRLRDMNSRILL